MTGKQQSKWPLLGRIYEHTWAENLNVLTLKRSLRNDYKSWFCSKWNVLWELNEGQISHTGVISELYEITSVSGRFYDKVLLFILKRLSLWFMFYDSFISLKSFLIAGHMDI